MQNIILPGGPICELCRVVDVGNIGEESSLSPVPITKRALIEAQRHSSVAPHPYRQALLHLVLSLINGWHLHHVLLVVPTLVLEVRDLFRTV